MKKLLFITKSMVCGGVERTLLNLLHSLDRDKYEIDLLLLEKNGSYLELVPDDVNIIEAEIPDSLRKVIHCNDLGFKKGLISILQDKNFFTALVFLWLTTIDRFSKLIFKKSFLFRLCSKKTKLPQKTYDVVCDYHGYGYYTTYLALRFKYSKKFSWIHIENIDKEFYFARKTLNQFDGIFGVSPKCIQNFKEKLPCVDSNKLILLYNLLLKDDILEKSQQEPLINYKENSRFLIVSIGRLSTQKAFDLTIDTAKVLKDSGKDFLWVIIGEGPERLHLENMIESYELRDNVILHGLDINPYVYLAMADLYVQTSRFEGFATTLSEAVVLQKPIVSTRFSGVEQQVKDGVNGFLTDFNRFDVSDKIGRMMDDSELRQRCAEGCTKINLPTDSTLPILEQCFN